VILNMAGDPGDSDLLRVGNGVAADQLWFRQTGMGLEISIIGTSDRVAVSNMPGFDGIDRIELSDGRYLLDSQVANLVDAMAAFSPPGTGQTTLPEACQQQLATVIAANWQGP
jgi:hypothetical protein